MKSERLSAYPGPLTMRRRCLNLLLPPRDSTPQAGADKHREAQRFASAGAPNAGRRTASHKGKPINELRAPLDISKSDLSLA